MEYKYGGITKKDTNPYFVKSEDCNLKVGNPVYWEVNVAL